jgi:hypothetical protein
LCHVTGHLSPIKFPAQTRCRGRRGGTANNVDGPSFTRLLDEYAVIDDHHPD